MATLTRTLIKNIDKLKLAELIKQNYNIGRTAELHSESREVFLDQMNYAFIISEAYLNGWTEIEFCFNTSIDEHDIFLKKLSKDYSTRVISGYEQTTTGDIRFVALNNGEILRAIYQRSYFEPHRLIMEQNVGDRLQTEKNFNYPEVGEDLAGNKVLNFDEVQEMFRDAGYTGEARPFFEENYLHLEYLRG